MMRWHQSQRPCQQKWLTVNPRTTEIARFDKRLCIGTQTTETAGLDPPSDTDGP
jgi:hypothetical protein